MHEADIRASQPRRTVAKHKWVRTMKAVVDQIRCNGCELCVELCPEVFDMNGDSAEVIVDEMLVESLDACEMVAEACPVEAIRIEV
jgi:ferredoxin